jgi:hypothetical protein
MVFPGWRRQTNEYMEAKYIFGMVLNHWIRTIPKPMEIRNKKLFFKFLAMPR